MTARAAIATAAEYLTAATDLLINDLAWMAAQWAAGGAGREAVTKDENAGFSAILTGIGSLSYGERAGERMRLGLMLNDPEEEHNCFSDNTHNSHYYDGLGIQNVYRGEYIRIDGSMVSGPSLSDLVAEPDAALDGETQTRLSTTMRALGRIKTAAKAGTAYDQMLARGNAAGEAQGMGGVDGLIDQTRTIERVVRVLGVGSIAFVGSDSLDDPGAVFQQRALIRNERKTRNDQTGSHSWRARAHTGQTCAGAEAWAVQTWPENPASRVCGKHQRPREHRAKKNMHSLVNLKWMRRSNLCAVALMLVRPVMAGKVAMVTQPGSDFTKPEQFKERPADTATVRARDTADAFSDPSDNITFEDDLKFKVGNGLFRKIWVSSPASTLASDGLGPLYNARSCQRCHIKEGRGHPPEGPDDNAVSMFLRVSIPGDAAQVAEIKDCLGAAPDPAYGTQLQDHALPGIPAEYRLRIDYEEIPVK